MVETKDQERPCDGAGRTCRQSQAMADSGWIDSRTLFGQRDEIVIRHGDQVYRLKITRYGKLILNK